MRGCVGWSAPSFFANPHNISNISNMFHGVGQDLSVHMHSLVISSTAGLNKMINFLYRPMNAERCYMHFLVKYAFL